MEVAESVLRWLVLAAALIASGTPAAGDTALSARVMPENGSAPADIMVQAFIEPDERNRSVSFTVESDSFYGSSEAVLEGERAARVVEMRFRMLPKGSYEVRVVLFGASGERSHVVRTVVLV